MFRQQQTRKSGKVLCAHHTACCKSHHHQTQHHTHIIKSNTVSRRFIQNQKKIKMESLLLFAVLFISLTSSSDPLQKQGVIGPVSSETVSSADVSSEAVVSSPVVSSVEDECPAVASAPRSNRYDCDPQSYFGNGKYGTEWDGIVNARRAWKEADWTDPSAFDPEHFMFFVHSLRTKDRLWEFRGSGVESRDERHAKHRREFIDEPVRSMSKRLLSLSLIDQDHPQIFGACAGWILRVDPTSIFATATTDMSLVNAYGKKVLQHATSLPCWQAICGENGKSMCDTLRTHLLAMYSKHGIRAPHDLLGDTDSENEIFPYNEIAALGTSPDTMHVPEVIGVVFGDNKVLYATHAEDCEVLRGELEAKARERGIPVVRLSKPEPRIPEVAEKDDKHEEHDERAEEIQRLQAKLEKLKPILEKNPAARTVAENIQAEIRALSSA